MVHDSLEDDKWLSRMLMLLPGFFSLAIAGHVIGSLDLDSFSIVGYSLALSLVNFYLALLLYRLVSFLVTKVRRSPASAASSKSSIWPQLSLPFIAVVLIFSAFLGLVIGYSYSTDIVLASLRHGPFVKPFTRRSVSRPLVFLLAENRRGELEEGRPPSMKQGQVWVEIHIKGGTSFSGYPEFFPLGDQRSEIFLSPACSQENGIRQWPGPGILIPEAEVSYIAFVDRDASDCHNLWKQTALSTRTIEPRTSRP